MKKLLHLGLILTFILALALSGCGGGNSGGSGGTSRYTLNITVENGPGCTVAPATGTAYPAGTVVDLTPAGAAGYALDHWGGTDGAKVTPDSKITMDGNKNIVAVFAKLKYNLTAMADDITHGSVAVRIVPPVSALAKTASIIEYGQTVELTARPNSGYLFDHWQGCGLSGNANPVTLTLTGDPTGTKTVTAIFAAWQFLDIPLRRVPGAAGFPTGIGDSGTCVTVNYPYWMAETEVTYAQWSAVYNWAVNHGYSFAHAGTMGDGSGDTPNHPVTYISWRDAIIWCNALTEYYNAQNGTGLGCVYKSGSDPIRNANDGGTCDTVVPEASAKGFRLPTSMEWELAGRYKDGSSWTPGNYASGAIADNNNIIAIQAVAWYSDNSGFSTHPVAGKSPNVLGLYDMSGNAWEWCFDIYSGSARVDRGGSWYNGAGDLRLGYVGSDVPSYVNNILGFRPVRTE